MAFLDEKIAKLQKEARMAKKYSDSNQVEQEEIEEENIKELSQEEVTQAIKNGLLELNEEKLIFEKKICFEGKFVIPMLKDFFDESIENEAKYSWNKKHVLSISLSNIELKAEINSIYDLKEKIKTSFKEYEVYIELLNSHEEINENFSKFIITSRMPTALDYMYQYMIYLKFKDEMFSLIFTCLEKDKRQWEKIMIGIGEVMEINEGDKESNE